jgi:hypothetical protein
VAAAVIASLVIGGVVVLAMIGVSCYGWLTLPADARVPIHFGAGYNNFVPKSFGLILHPLAGVVIFVISVAMTRNPAKASSAVYIFPVVMCVLLVVQVGAIKVARSRSGTFG